MQRSTPPLALLVGLGLAQSSCADRPIVSESDAGGSTAGQPASGTGASTSGTAGTGTQGQASAGGSTSTSTGGSSGSTLSSSPTTTTAGVSTTVGPISSSSSSAPDETTSGGSEGTTHEVPDGACEPAMDPGTTGEGESEGGVGVPPEDVEACEACHEQGYCWITGESFCESFACWDERLQDCVWCGPCLQLIYEEQPKLRLADDGAVGVELGAAPRERVIDRVLDQADLPADVLARLRARVKRGRAP